jgi:hypothetical protein
MTNKETKRQLLEVAVVLSKAERKLRLVQQLIGNVVDRNALWSEQSESVRIECRLASVQLADANLMLEEAGRTT